jgi:hypothetical protein
MKKSAILVFALVGSLSCLTSQASTVLIGPDVNNGSFENPGIQPQGSNGTVYYQFANPDGWAYTGSGGIAIQTSGTFTSIPVTVTAPHGYQYANVCQGGKIVPTASLGAFEASTVYTLTGFGTKEGVDAPEMVLNGIASLLPAAPDYTFMAFAPVTIDTMAHPELIGTPIAVELRVPGVTYGMFDDINLTATSVPEPVGMILLGLGGLFLRRK